MCKIVILIVAALALTSAQDTITTTASTTTAAAGSSSTAGSTVSPTPTAPQYCNSDSLTGMDWNNTLLLGSWLELTRTPIGSTEACVIFTTALVVDNTTLSISGLHSSNPTSLYQNVHEDANVKLLENATGYWVNFIDDNTLQTPVFIKLLEFANNNTYIIGCGYTNKMDESTSYGFILGRNGSTYNANQIQTVNNQAATLYSNFKANNATIIQQDGCYQNSASQSLPLIIGVFTLALLLIKAH